MLVVAFGNPGIPPPGFSIWRALRSPVRPRSARVAAGPPGMDQAGTHPGARRKYTCRQDRSVPYRVEHCRSAPNPRRRNYFQHEVIKNTKITCAFIRSDDRRRAAIAAREQPACDEILSRSLPSRSYNELTFVKACCHVSAHVHRVPHRHQRPGAPTEKQNGRTFAW